MEGDEISEHIGIGSQGERLAALFLRERNFLLLGTNYRKKWGEIDLIMKRREIVHFVEVKTVSYETIGLLEYNVSRGTSRPEENVHSDKLRRLYNTIQTWISENNYEGEYQLDVVTVRMVPREKYAVVDHISNVYLE